jgi:hypothetical protein
MSRFVLLLVLLLCAPFAGAEDKADAWTSFSEKVGSTLPFPLGSDEARAEGFWHGVWDGTKRILSEGSQDLYVSGYYYHTPYHFSEHRRDEFNDNAWGLGYGRTLAEENQNQRMFYGMVVRDSHQKPFYLAGYAWVARWDFYREVQVGAGYSAAARARGVDRHEQRGHLRHLLQRHRLLLREVQPRSVTPPGDFACSAYSPYCAMSFATSPVQPVWWEAPRPAPVSP